MRLKITAQAPAAPVVEGFVFDKWDADFSSVTEDMTVNAIYVAETYTLSYNTDGGDELADEVYRVGDIPVKPATPYKGGYTFVGWYLDADFVTPYDFSTGFNADTTVYAYFSESIPISTAEELKAIGDYSTGKYHLTQNISLDGTVWTPLWYFEGELDGRGYQISDFVISSEDYLVGFFATNNGTIKNLTLSDFVFSVSVRESQQTFTAGPLVGSNSGTIENCHIQDAVLNCDDYKTTKGTDTYHSYIGGLVGRNSGNISDSTITAEIRATVEVYFYADSTRYLETILHVGGIASDNSGRIEGTISSIVVSGTSLASGLAGAHPYPGLRVAGAISENSGTVQYCKSYMDVSCFGQIIEAPWSGEACPYLHCGGFTMDNHGTISECYATGKIEITGFSKHVRASGFIDKNYGQIKNCQADVEINSVDGKYPTDGYLAGFVGMNYGTISTSYSKSTITNEGQCATGGFVGKNESGGVISKCFATGDIIYTNAPAEVGLFVGSANDGGTLFKNYYNAESKILQGENDVTVEDSNATATDLATLQSKAFLIDTLGWNAEIWEVVDGKYPALIAIK